MSAVIKETLRAVYNPAPKSANKKINRNHWFIFCFHPLSVVQYWVLESVPAVARSRNTPWTDQSITEHAHHSLPY